MSEERSNVSIEFKRAALIQKQSLPLEQKILLTKQRIREWYDHWNGQVYVSFSGGKDSTVLKHIVDSMYDDVTAVFVNTGLEYPELQRFVRDVKDGKFDCFNSDIEIIRPEMRFDEVIQKYGYPVVSKEVSQVIEEARKWADTGRYTYRMQQLNGELLDKHGNKSRYNCEKWKFLLDADFKISNKCCDVMKKRPIKKYEKKTGRKSFIGTMASESMAREQAWMKTGCNAYESKCPRSTPLSFWTEQDVLHYIKKFNVPYCMVYGDIQIKKTGDTIDGQLNAIDILSDYKESDILETTGCNRTGCMFCMFGCHLEKKPNRFQRMKLTHPKQYAYCMDKLGLKEVLQYIGVPYE